MAFQKAQTGASTSPPKRVVRGVEAGMRMVIGTGSVPSAISGLEPAGPGGGEKESWEIGPVSAVLEKGSKAREATLMTTAPGEAAATAANTSGASGEKRTGLPGMVKGWEASGAPGAVDWMATEMCTEGDEKARGGSSTAMTSSPSESASAERTAAIRA